LKKSRFHIGAANELEEAFDFYKQISGVIANAFWKEVNMALFQIEQNPDAYSRVYSKHRKYLLQRFPFALIYIEYEEFIYIVAFMHQKRKPGYWKKRIK